MALDKVTRSAANAGPRSAITKLMELHNDLVALTSELKTDYTALLADVTAIRTALLAVTAKLDADAGVTDTNYAATCNPAALTATAIAAADSDTAGYLNGGAQ